MSLYQQGDLVLLASNRYHMGIVRANQASSRDGVLVEWMRTPPVDMRADEIVRESTHREKHPAHLEPRDRPLYDVFEPIFEEKNLWQEAMQ